MNSTVDDVGDDDAFTLLRIEVLRQQICADASIDARDLRFDPRVQYVLNNPGRAPACCSSREGDALFEEMRQEGNLIAARNAVCQILPERNVQLAARRL